ncbi:MAG: hypothetical protein A3A33_03805 [Candidatus Yanofskybacteria bacterium RIFCSPLOWO2_01_FULL_49_25]|uniref:Dihydrofolate reductase n=1 Tax=Candidatus Yanofskybacteria bacterium RIFCSPLOWO2_01_FULL_49_25 TaxID=1802701 RepID=A0A1F8GV85_9BACT|nr:MAG: hypothetical protein A3A33_03805 [Candidatus Yanofskybacteria bacterium RIFCSPLOWO2_01_FULL_49_25]
MLLSLIAAFGNNRAIGEKNTLPWSMPADLKRFREVTSGHPIIMGRKTYESIGRPLPKRLNIVVTRDQSLALPGCTVAHSLDEALATMGTAEEAFVIGGGQLFAEALPRADRMYLTFINATFPGDVFFPEYDTAQWREISREDHVADAENPHPYSFVTLERK